MSGDRADTSATTAYRSIEPVPASTIGRFDHEADIVVVGLGCAGAAAAFEGPPQGH
jgi:3-oxo-5alpha-steroid 4-dehydrogenase